MSGSEITVYFQYAKIKAAELEDYHSGVLVGTALEGKDEPAAKKRRDEKAEGEKIVNDFIEAVKAIPIDSLSEEEVYAQVQKLKDEVRAKNNFYIQDLLAKCTRCD